MNKKLAFSTLVFGMLICLFFSSCNPGLVFSNQQSVPNEWKSTDIIQFEFENSDTLSNHQFLLRVRNNTDYAYQNIFFFVKLIQPDGIINIDTVECQLADYSGKWLGSGFGKIKEVSTVFGSDFILNRSGNYKVAIEHAMRVNKDEGLIGIEDIGIQIIKN